MLSESIYKRMMVDPEFLKRLETARVYATENPATNNLEEMNRSYHELHMNAFELSVIYSPRASSRQVLYGDFMISLMTVSRIGRIYLLNLLEGMKTVNKKSIGLKRIDKLESVIHLILGLLDGIESSVETSLKEYTENGKEPSRSFISTQSKRLLKIRRSYFRIMPKIREISKHIKFSSYSYKCYEPLTKLIHISNNKNRRLYGAAQIRDVIPENAYFSIPTNMLNKSKLHKDKENTSFILKYSIPSIMIKKA